MSTELPWNADNGIQLIELPDRTRDPVSHYQEMGGLHVGRPGLSSSQGRETAGSSSLSEVSANATAAAVFRKRTEGQAEDGIDGMEDRQLIRRLQEVYGRTNAQVEVERNMWQEELERSHAGQPVGLAALSRKALSENAPCR